MGLLRARLDVASRNVTQLATESLTYNPQSLSFDCNGNLYAVTGANAAGETFSHARSLLKVSTATGAPTLVCAFTSTDTVQVGVAVSARDGRRSYTSDGGGRGTCFCVGDPLQVGAFISASILAVFRGTSTPVMALMTVSQFNPARCVTSTVGAYTDAALLRFSGQVNHGMRLPNTVPLR